MVPSGPLRYAARVIQAGGVVAYPTESVFGLGCDRPPAGADPWVDDRQHHALG